MIETTEIMDVMIFYINRLTNTKTIPFRKKLNERVSNSP